MTIKDEYKVIEKEMCVAKFEDCEGDTGYTRNVPIDQRGNNYVDCCGPVCNSCSKMLKEVEIN